MTLAPTTRADTKRCRDCNQYKPHAEFYKGKNNRDGLLSYCKDCQHERVRSWRNSKRGRAYHRAYYHKTKKKQKARYTVSNAIKRGEMKPASEYDCKHCGDQAAEYHHPDYDRPLFVIPLCVPCHRNL